MEGEQHAALVLFPRYWLLCMVLGAAYLLSQELWHEVEGNQHRGWSPVMSVPIVNVPKPWEVQEDLSPSGLGLNTKRE